jgi:uncharacterized protein YkwD
VPPILASLTAAAIAFAPSNHAATPGPVAQRAPSSTNAARVHLSTLESQLLGQINNLRARHGLRRLRLSHGLTTAAVQHSASMAQKGYFAHESADGSSFFRRIAYYYPYRGYSRWSAGENILYSTPDIDSGAALRLWLNSPEHRANLLSRSWREIGLGAFHSTSAPGVYNGDAVTVVTADFGVRY